MNQHHDPVVILGAARTPVGSFQGVFSDLAAHQLGKTAIEGAIARSGIQKTQIQEVLMGCVLSAGQGQAPARQAALGAGLPYGIPCTTVNKMCGSGLKTIALARDTLLAKEADFIVAGGMESMTNAPYLLQKARAGIRLGHDQIYDHMFLDGLEDAYEKGNLMGVFAERTAEHYAFTRQAQDAYALQSLQKAQTALQEGFFKAEIVPVHTRTGFMVEQDETPTKSKPEKIPHLKPVFKPNGTVTAANSSSISDGAAAVVLSRLSTAQKHSLTPLAIIHATASHAQEPAWFTTAPIGAIQKIFQKTGWTTPAVDLYEINEAFAVVAMASIQELNLDQNRVNIHGGACALGHPIGASGARILVTLIYALKQQNVKKGIAALCIGGGEAIAIAIENV